MPKIQGVSTYENHKPQLQIEMQPFQFIIELYFLKNITMPCGCTMAYKNIGIIPVFFVS
jgi:hypothetical protein